MTDIRYRASRVLVAASVLASVTPSVALAEEEENTGMMLLMPNMAEFIPACVAFIIIFIIASKMAWPSVLKMMDDREKKIQGDLDAAAQAREKAEAAEADIAAKLESAEREAQEIIAEAKRDAENERSRIIAEGQASAQALIAKAHASVADEREKAMIELSGQVVDLSVEIASKIIGNGLSEEAQRELAERYLLEVGSLYEE